MLLTAVAALALAARAPLTVTVLGLIAFGVLHNVLEIRYVAGRFAAILTGRFLILLFACSGIVACRIWWPVPGPARYAEVGIGYLILAVGCGTASAAAGCSSASACWPWPRWDRSAGRRTTS